jgi:hypothetical protein
MASRCHKRRLDPSVNSESFYDRFLIVDFLIEAYVLGTPEEY